MVRRAGGAPRAGRGRVSVGGARGRTARTDRGTARGRLRRAVRDLTPVELAALILSAGGRASTRSNRCSARASDSRCCSSGSTSCRSQRHDFGGSANALLAGFVRRIDRLKAHLVGAETTRTGRGGCAVSRRAADVASSASSPRCTACTSRCWPKPARRDAGDLIRDALRVIRERPATVAAVRARAGRRRARSRPGVGDAEPGGRGVAADAAADPARAARGLRLEEFAHSDRRSSRSSGCRGACSGRHPPRRRARPSRRRRKARSRSGAAPTSGPRRSRSPPTSSG